MTITCTTMEQFMDCIYQSVVRGITFKAYAETLTITYTGGY